VNWSIDKNCVNISNFFLNNECVNIYVAWYQLYNFLRGEGDVDIIDLDYTKELEILFNKQIISSDNSKTSFMMRSAALFIEIIPKVKYSTAIAIPTW